MESRNGINILRSPLRAMALAAAASLAALLLQACAWHSEIEKNQDNLAKLRIGMSKIEVKAIMGEPLVKEIYSTPDVWYYYTQLRWHDGNATRDECTPLVFDEDGKLAGIGKKYFKENYEFNVWRVPGAGMPAN